MKAAGAPQEPCETEFVFIGVIEAGLLALAATVPLLF